MNPYAYVAQNPETLTDPSGQMVGCPGCGNSGGGGGNQGGGSGGGGSCGDNGCNQGGGMGDPGAGGHQGGGGMKDPGAGGSGPKTQSKKVVLAQQTAFSTAENFEDAAMYFATLAVAIAGLAVWLAPYLAKAAGTLLGTVIAAITGLAPLAFLSDLFALSSFLGAASVEAGELAGVYAGAASSSRSDWTSGVVTEKLDIFVPQILSNAHHTDEAIDNIWNGLQVVKVFSAVVSLVPGGQKVAQYFNGADDGRLLADYISDNLYTSWVDGAQQQFGNLGLWVEGSDGSPEKACEMFCNS